MENAMLDLTSLLSNVEEQVIVDTNISYSKEALENIEIEELNNVHVHGMITKNSASEVVASLKVNGIMIILDSISLEPVEYPFSFEINENVVDFSKNDENTLDISELLWENIVLEIPLKFTKVKDLSKFHGDGWKLISEDEKQNSNNPFTELLKNFKEE